MRSALYCLTFSFDKASNLTFSPFCGTVTVTPSIGRSTMKGSIISFALLLNRSLNSTIPIEINSSSLSSSFFEYSIVKAWVIQPFLICKKLTKAFFSSLSIEKTSRFVIDELTTSLLNLKFSISLYFSFISCAASKSNKDAFSAISASIFSCKTLISPFNIDVISLIILQYSSADILPTHGAGQFFI